MTSPSILTQFKFTDRQRKAVTSRSPAIGVTAGAGSGKTRALVGRYLHLLERGYPLRSLVAITFTDKAAREMRTRIRLAIEQRLNAATGDREMWETAFTELDAARIGTIHSLCAEILRAHPSEAGIDPNFVVLEEGLAAALQSQAVEAALAWAATQPDAARLFTLFSESDLRRISATLLDRRLDVATTLKQAADLDRWSSAIATWLDGKLRVPDWTSSLDALADLRARKPDDKLEAARQNVLAQWAAIQSARDGQDWDSVFASLAQLRSAVSTGGQKANWDANALDAARAAMRALRDHYDAELAPLIGKEPSIRWSLDRQIAELLPALQLLYAQVQAEYQRLKEQQQALDFDDLEGLAARLLSERADVRERWQSGVRAVLVDEFQDTNERQRQIVYVLGNFGDDADARADASLFIVGDAKQSIYKFRRADVSVFRGVVSDIAAAGGQTIDLDLTFRAHKPLLDLTNALLAPVLGEIDDPAQPYAVPFAPLRAQRKSAETSAPYVEFQLGLGEDAEAGRRAAAAALTDRLWELRRAEEFDWGEVALLFRSSTAFGVYEDALERAGIPFVTVAGRGFYDRPEIRDVLNALTAVADPTDDLAMAGLLRSPAFGLSDADLYRLRFGDDDRPRPLWETLSTTFEASGDFGSLTLRAREIILELHALAGRVPAAAVLKRFLDRTGYGVILGTAPEGNRLRRNVDKLLADAHRSRLIGLGDFLEYVQTLRDVGVREGEAPVEAGGAVQLLTVHKAKGLEFPLVVIADAAYEHRGRADVVLLDDQLGLLPGLTDVDGARPVAWRLASLIEAAKDEAEDKRLLYVATTRAKEKLIVSGHVKRTAKGQLNLRGWLARWGEVIGLNEITLEDESDAPLCIDVRCPDPSAGPIGCVLHPGFALTEAEMTPAESPLPVDTAPPMSDLVAPITAAPGPNADQKLIEREIDPPSRVWRVVPRARRPTGPAWVVGKLTHEALRRWRFPDAGDFDVFLYPFALEAGLTDRAEIQSTLNETRRLLSRFQSHPLYHEIADAERHHEVPYTLPGDSGIIDLLYRTGAGWTIVDFKTDELHSEIELRAAIEREGYDAQLRRYVDAITTQLGQRPRAQLVFLRVAGQVQAVELTETEG